MHHFPPSSDGVGGIYTVGYLQHWTFLTDPTEQVPPSFYKRGEIDIDRMVI
jgi:hypothetical protein